MSLNVTNANVVGCKEIMFSCWSRDFKGVGIEVATF